MKRFIVAGVLFASATTIQAAPTIHVGAMYDYLNTEKSTFLKRIDNSGDSTAFVKISIAEIIMGEDGSMTEQVVPPMTNSVERRGLVASPARLIIPGSGRQTTRLLFLEERDHERYYRVRYVPVVPEKSDEFGLSDAEIGTAEKALSAGLNVLTGFGTMVIVRPVPTVFDTRLEQLSEHYRVVNQGNSTVVLDEFKDCAINDETNCKDVFKHHLRPGKTFDFPLVKGRHYRFDLMEADARRPVEVTVGV